MLSSRNLLMLTGLGALLAIVVLFAGLVTRAGPDSALPAADAQPSIAVPTPSPSTTASAAPTSAATAEASADTDERGFVESAARCADGQTAVAFGNTQRSRVAICAESGGGYQYRGVRISDGATLTVTAESTGDGAFEARSNDAVYTVSPAGLRVTSGGKVIYRDTWIAYQAPSTPAAKPR
jgi:hypothetical protein